LTTNISGSLIGLSILSGTNGFQLMGTQPVESAAARAARLLFTTPDTTPPWSLPPSSTPDSAQVGAIRAMKTIIDQMNPDEAAGSNDVEGSFVTYKALDRLRILANAAAQPGMSDTQRAQLQATFAKGMADLEGFLAKVPTDLVNIAFGNPATSVKSTSIKPTTDIGTTIGKGVMDSHTQPVPGVSGNEVLTINLAKGSQKANVNVDLSTIANQPPTLDDIAKAFNDAIASVGGYDVKFSVTKSSGKYGLSMSSDGTQVSLDQVGAQDSLVVVGSQTQYDAPVGAQVYHYGDPASGLIGQLIGNVSATQPGSGKTATSTDTTDDGSEAKPAAPLPANLVAQSTATGKDGYTYVVGTTTGDMGSHLANGGDDLFLTKVDSQGQIVWQQKLGAQGDAQGAAVSLTPQGDVVVAGSVTGPFDGGLGSNSDMLVAKFSANGEKQFATSVPSSGDDYATAVAVGPDGSIYLGGKSAGTGGGGAYVAHMDASGKIIQQRVIDGAGVDGVTAFALDGSGNLLALTREGGQAMLHKFDGQDLNSELAQANLGTADARAIAVAADGSIAVVGATTSALPDNPSYNPANGRDGFVTRLAADLTGASTTYVGGAGDDQIDSVSFMGSDIYVGGRTTSNLNGAVRGKVDGFVGHLDGSTGAVAAISQFGGGAGVSDAIHVSVDKGGSNILGALGLRQGVLNDDVSTSLSTQIGLNAGDSFSFQVDGGAVHKITIADGETLTSLQRKIKLAGGNNVSVTIHRDTDDEDDDPNDASQGGQLQLQVTPGHTLGLMSGPTGTDALSKLGLEPTRLHSDAPRDAKDPLVKPGGSYGLALSTSLGIGTVKDAKATLDLITSAISLTQTAYRSLYWDDTKAAQASGNVGKGSAYQQAQIASYQAALDRLSQGSNGLMLL
jgi:hypothetical protein